MLVPRRVVSISWVHPPPIVSNRQKSKNSESDLMAREGLPTYISHWHPGGGYIQSVSHYQVLPSGLKKVFLSDPFMG